MNTFDKRLSIYPDVDIFEALACVGNYISERKKEPREIGIAGGIVYVMKATNNALFVYQTKTQYVVRHGEYIRIFGSEEGEEPKRRYYHLFCVPGQDQAPVIEAMKDVWYQNA